MNRYVLPRMCEMIGRKVNRIMFTYQGVSANSLRITPAPNSSYYLTSAHFGYADSTTNDTLQRMVCRLHSLNVGVQVIAGLHTTVTACPTPSGEQVWFGGLDGHGPMQVSVFDAQRQFAVAARITSQASGSNVNPLTLGSCIIRLSTQGPESNHLKWLHS